VGSEGYELLCNLCIPEKLANLTMERLAEIMQNHLQPSEISQRYKFKECKQMAEENIKTYLAKLKKLSALWGTVGEPHSGSVRVRSGQ